MPNFKIPIKNLTGKRSALSLEILQPHFFYRGGEWQAISGTADRERRDFNQILPFFSLNPRLRIDCRRHAKPSQLSPGRILPETRRVRAGEMDKRQRWIRVRQSVFSPTVRPRAQDVHRKTSIRTVSAGRTHKSKIYIIL